MDSTSSLPDRPVPVLPNKNAMISMQDIEYERDPIKGVFANPAYNKGASREVPDNVRPSLSPPPAYREVPDNVRPSLSPPPSYDMVLPYKY